MNQPILPSAPWLGEDAVAQWQLWRAGNEWAARTGWFTPLPVLISTPAEHPPNRERLDEIREP
jgi:hypothetical protein